MLYIDSSASYHSEKSPVEARRATFPQEQGHHRHWQTDTPGLCISRGQRPHTTHGDRLQLPQVQ